MLPGSGQEEKKVPSTGDLHVLAEADAQEHQLALLPRPLGRRGDLYVGRSRGVEKALQIGLLPPTVCVCVCGGACACAYVRWVASRPDADVLHTHDTHDTRPHGKDVQVGFQRHAIEHQAARAVRLLSAVVVAIAVVVVVIVIVIAAAVVIHHIAVDQLRRETP
jgi:hypothetical protein